MISPWLNWARAEELKRSDLLYLGVIGETFTYTMVMQLERRRRPVLKQR